MQVLANLLVKGNKPWINGIWFGFYRKNAFLNHFFGRGKYAGQQGNLSQLRTNPIQKLGLLKKDELRGQFQNRLNMCIRFSDAPALT